MTLPQRLTVVVLLALGLVAPALVAAQPTDFDVYVSEAILAVEDKQWDKAIDPSVGDLCLARSRNGIAAAGCPLPM